MRPNELGAERTVQRRGLRSISKSLGFAVCGLCLTAGGHGLAHPPADIHLEYLGTYQPPDVAFNEGVSEIVAYDPDRAEVYVVNAHATRLEVISIDDPTHPVSAGLIDVSTFGASANSVAVRDGLVAVAVEAPVKQDPGVVVLMDTEGNFLSSLPVGALPDNVVISPNGRWVLAACEGEPSDDYTRDPEGSIAVIDVGCSPEHATVRMADFHAWNALPLPASVRVFGPGANASRDFEPEYITVSADSRWAWATLQENNAIAKIDIFNGRIAGVYGLGFKDHSLAANALDASDKDNAINIRNWPVKGMYLPDSIGSFRSSTGTTYLVMANEGDSRAYTAFNEETRVGSVALDPTRFPDAANLKAAANLGRLKITNTLGDSDGDGDYDELYAFGARSISIRTTSGALVWDSGSQIEQTVATALPGSFNANWESNKVDDRSDDKGPEAEGIAVGRAHGRQLVFVGLERVGGIVTFDATNPSHPVLVDYINHRDFTKDPLLDLTTVGDLAPEGLAFVPEDESPICDPILIVGNEVSGTTTVYAVRR
ncbi:MAG: choice-of-anchor I family protein [Myxococcota bacterium]